MKAALLTTAVLSGLFSILFLWLPDKEELKKTVSLLFSAAILLVLFQPLLSGELFLPLLNAGNQDLDMGGITAGEEYLKGETENAVREGIRAAVADRFSLPKKEIAVTASFDGSLTPKSVQVTLTGKSAFSDLVGIEAYGKTQICENFEVLIFGQNE